MRCFLLDAVGFHSSAGEGRPLALWYTQNGSAVVILMTVYWFGDVDRDISTDPLDLAFLTYLANSHSKTVTFSTLGERYQVGDQRPL
jgi:hypothetical protein